MIEFFVSGQSLKFFTPVVAADSLNYLTAKVNFNEEWVGYSKWIHFRQGEDLSATVYDISLDENDEVTSDDALNLGIGEWEIYVTGTKDSSRLTTETVILTVKESGLIDAPLHGLPMSVAEQVDFKANQALLVAMSVKEAADSGKFIGETGPQGPAGEVGPRGPQGIQGPQGPKGLKGDPGTGLYISGTVTSVDKLPSSAEQSEMWNVGNSEPYTIYMYDNGQWISIGQLQGAKGDNGENGVTFTPSVDENGYLSWSNNGGLTNPDTVNIKGPQGLAGAPGATGPQGETGPQGPAGAAGPAGPKGDSGDNGVTFTPNVDANGNISWTNDGGLENPVVRNIRGPEGKTGAQGADGKSPYQIASENGYTGTETTFNNSLTAFPYHNARHLPDGADPITVKTGNIEDGAVTTAKIANAAVTRAKLANDALYSPIININTSTYSIVSTDIGKTLKTGYNVNVAITLTQAVSSTMPVGTEIAIAKWSTATYTATLIGSGVRFGTTAYGLKSNQTLKMVDPYGMIAIKKFSNSPSLGDGWLVTGNVEVVT